MLRVEIVMTVWGRCGKMDSKVKLLRPNSYKYFIL